MFLTEAPFLPIARPICPLPTTKMSRPCFSSIMQSFAVAPLMFWNSDIRPSCSEVSLISVVPPSPLELLQLVLTERPQGDDRDPEGSPQHPRKLRGGHREDAALGSGDAVPPDLLDVALGGHQVGHQEDVPDVDLQPLLVEGAHHLPDERLPRSLDAEDLSDFVNVVRYDPLRVDSIHGHDLPQLGSRRLDEPLVAFLDHGDACDPRDSLQLHVEDLVPQREECGKVRVLHVYPDYLSSLVYLDIPLPCLYHLRDLLGLCVSVQHRVLAQVQLDPLGGVDLAVLDDVPHLREENLLRDLQRLLVGGPVLFVEVDVHRRRRGDLAGVDELHQPRQA